MSQPMTFISNSPFFLGKFSGLDVLSWLLIVIVEIERYWCPSISGRVLCHGRARIFSLHWPFIVFFAVVAKAPKARSALLQITTTLIKFCWNTPVGSMFSIFKVVNFPHTSIDKGWREICFKIHDEDYSMSRNTLQKVRSIFHFTVSYIR